MVDTPANLDGVPIIDAPPAPTAHEAVPINARALQEAAQSVSAPIPVFREHPNGDEPINKGMFVRLPDPSQPVAQPEDPSGANTPAQPAAQNNNEPAPDAGAAQPVAHPEGSPITKEAWETFQAQHNSLQEELDRLKAQRVEFANPLVEKLNSVFHAGGGIADAARVIRGQEIDTAQMKPLELIRAAVVFQHPDMDSEEIEAHMSRLGIDPEDPEGASSRAAIKVESKRAMDYLESLKVDLSNPKPLADAAALQAQQAQNAAAWQKVAPPEPVLKVKELIDGIEVLAEVPLSSNAIAFADNATASMRSQPLTEAAIANYRELHAMLASAFDSQNIQKTLVEAAVKATKASVLKSVAGPTPVPVPHKEAPPPAKEQRPRYPMSA